MHSTPGVHEPAHMVRLWLHECERTFADRMTDEGDIHGYHDTAMGIARQYFGEAVDIELAFQGPNLWGPFFHSQATGEECAYGQVQSYEWLGTFLNRKLEDYNMDFAAMKLVRPPALCPCCPPSPPPPPQCHVESDVVHIAMLLGQSVPARPTVCLSHRPCACPTDRVPVPPTVCLSHRPCACPTDRVPVPPTVCLSHRPCACPIDRVPVPPTVSVAQATDCD